MGGGADSAVVGASAQTCSSVLSRLQTWPSSSVRQNFGGGREKESARVSETETVRQRMRERARDR